MLRGLYTAALGMLTEQKRTDVIANNLANADTSGYKKDDLISGEFESVLIHRINDKQDADNILALQHIDTARDYLLRGTVADGGLDAPVIGSLGRGSYVAEIATIHSQGPLVCTGNKLDLAIAGKGYFAVQTPAGVRYTRDGNFYRSANGQLVTANNQAVLDNEGMPINLPPNTADISIGPDGTIVAGKQNIGQIGLTEFKDRNEVIKEGYNLYKPQKNARPLPGTGTIEQGYLENSNVNIAKEMVELINNYRSYESDSKALTTQDSLLEKAVNDVGRVNG